ncbi:MAG TPA: pseudouridine-5'-phosphate glycosidase [Anaeromyxobacteraceae bacterium]|nr:pseudouridine-5'-phosphate glycosidase [Anaeromyxobacteraceae bacterium]
MPYSGAVEALHIAPEVREALAAGRGVVALETSVVAHGLPPPNGLEAARRAQAAVRAAGSVPATVAVLEGRVVVGAGEAELARLADPSRRAAKAGARDLAALLVARRDAGTTVSATAAAAARAGIRLFATGGVGGVHRASPGAPPDVSADLAELARTPVCVVCAGPKAILDLSATAEALETLGVPVVGWRTAEMPAFYTAESGVTLEHRVEDAVAAARLLDLHWRSLGRREGVLLCVPPAWPLPRAAFEEVLQAALARARAEGVAGKAVTPFLLGEVARLLGPPVVEANLALLEENARVAGEVAAALARRR